MSIHDTIVTILRARHAESPKPAGSLLDHYPENDAVIRSMFVNYRAGTPGQERGFRLGEGGLAVMSSYFQAFPVHFDPLPLYNAKHLLFLDRISDMPWAVDPEGTLWLFDPELAMRAKLVGDLDTFLTAFSS